MEREGGRLVQSVPRPPRGTVQMADGEVMIRTVAVQSNRLRAAVDRAYVDRYKTPGALK